MKFFRYFFVFAAFCFLASALGFHVARSIYIISHKPAAIKQSTGFTVEPQVYDFGKVKQGGHIATFILTNHTKKTLRTLHLNSSCTCMDASISKTRVEPGESIALDVWFDANERQGENTGHVAVAFVEADVSPEKPRYAIAKFRANVLAE